MSFHKKSNLSIRSKRRRVEEQLKSLPLSTSNDTQNIPSTSNLNLNLNDCTFMPLSNIAIDIPEQTSKTNFSFHTNFDVQNKRNISLDSDINCNNWSSSDENNDSISLNRDIKSDQVLVSLIAEWAVEFKISQIALNGLLCVLKQHKCFESVPKDSRTILNSKPIDVSNLHSVDPGEYYHFGLSIGIKQNIPSSLLQNNNTSVIQIIAGVDGLPLFKSSPEQFWPILAYIRPKSVVFPIGIYYGKEKPSDSNSFLKYFVEKANNLINNGIEIENKVFKVKIDALCCDAPAKSFLLKTKGHSGFFSCSRCEHEGEYLLNRICFPYTSPNRRPPKRTHQNYITKSKEEHHIGNISVLSTLTNFDCVNDFFLDYQHLVCLGVVRKLILLWVKGPIPIRYASWKIKEISKALVSLKTNIPCEMARKPRSLELINRWKSTELRMFIVYLGCTVTKPVLSNKHWTHLINLSLAMIILLSPDYGCHLDIAQKLLNNFVKNFEILYGRHLISHNVHGLTHLCDDFIKFGALDNCSTFPFENFMSTLKNLIRKPDKPLIQVIKRFNEMHALKSNPQKEKKMYTCTGPHTNGPLIENKEGLQYTTLNMEKCTIKTHIEADRFLLTNSNKIVKVFNIVDQKNSIYLICKQFEDISTLFDKPIKSTELDIYVVGKLSDTLAWYSINDIKKK